LNEAAGRLERFPSELNRGRDSRIGFDLLEDCRRAKEAAGMALSDDLRERVVGAVVEGGMSRNAAAKRFGVSIASAVRWVARFKTKGEISPAPTGGDRRSGRIEAHRDYLLGLVRRRPDMTLLEIQERLIANCGERFSSSVLWRFFDRHEFTLKTYGPPRLQGDLASLAADQSASTYPGLEGASSRPRWRYARSSPHKSLGVERRFLNQASGAPFDCQAISSSPSRKHP
jgi:transposase